MGDETRSKLARPGDLIPRQNGDGRFTGARALSIKHLDMAFAPKEKELWLAGSSASR